MNHKDPACQNENSDSHEKCTLCTHTSKGEGNVLCNGAHCKCLNSQCPNRHYATCVVHNPNAVITPQPEPKWKDERKNLLDFVEKFGFNASIVDSAYLAGTEAMKKTEPSMSDWEKKAIYTILDKICADKNYIDCAYEDINQLLLSERMRVREKIAWALPDLVDKWFPKEETNQRGKATMLGCDIIKAITEERI